MTSLDPIFRRLAVDLLTQFGKDVTLTRTQDTFNVNTNKRTPGAVTVYTLRASPPRTPTLQEVNENQAQRSDVYLTVAASNAAGVDIPALPFDINTDSFSIDGNNYRLVAAEPVYSGHQIAAFELQLRG